MIILKGIAKRMMMSLLLYQTEVSGFTCPAFCPQVVDLDPMHASWLTTNGQQVGSELWFNHAINIAHGTVKPTGSPFPWMAFI